MLALIPVGWYYLLILLGNNLLINNHEAFSWYIKLSVITGTIGACWILVLPRCRLWYVVSAPLLFAMVTGTGWLVISR